jgi:peptide alpha-N-acetyltransferase
MRDIPGFLDTRNKILQAKPANRTHWIGYAVAHHLAGNTDVAVQIINQYESTVVGGPGGGGG